MCLCVCACEKREGEVGRKAHHWGFALFLLAILFWVYLAKICVAFEITLPICMQIADCCRTPTAEIRFQSFLCCSLLLPGVLRCSFAIMTVTESCITAARVHRHTVIMRRRRNVSCDSTRIYMFDFINVGWCRKAT